MARIFRLTFAVFLFVLGAGLVSSASGSTTQPDASQGAAYSACIASAASQTSAGGPGGDKVVCIFFQSVAPYHITASACASTMSAGRYATVLDSNHAFNTGPLFDWCVPADCSVYDSGDVHQQWGGVYENGGVYCNSSCMSVFHMDSGVGSIQFPDGSGGSWGHFTGNGNRCVSSSDASLLKQAAPAPMVCDHGGASCYNPDKGFCGTTESGEMVCASAPPPGSGGCSNGATGSTCVGNNAAPPPPSDPPIAKGSPPSSSDTSTGKDSGGNVNNYTQNNYSGTSPGPGPSSSSVDPSGNSQSNSNGSGNSPGPSGSSGTDSNGKCGDGSVPTASGCSGSATDTGCDTPPQCYGDAVLCASFKEQVAIRCNTRAASSSSSGGYGDPAAALAANGVPADGGASGDPSASGLVTSSDLGEDGFDASGLGFSRSCPANPSFSVLGHSYTLDLTPFCNFASLLGWFVLLVALLAGLRIVATGKA